MDTAPIVKGEIVFEEGAPPFTGATIYVHLENITVSDVASELIADYVERDVGFNPKTNKNLIIRDSLQNSGPPS